jgi:ferric-dicitrate binding protein FerR (iron transport regulator)
MKRDEENIDNIVRRHLPSASRESMESDIDHLFRELHAMPAQTRDETATTPNKVRQSRRWQWSAVAAIAAGIAIAVLLPMKTQSAAAVLEDGVGSREIQYGEIVRPRGDTSAMLSITDGPRVEVRSESELKLERASDGGVRILLNRGEVIVDASGQYRGNLYVQTKDMTASVGGAVSLVNTEEQGSRVAAIGGEVRVQQGSTERKLRSGEQIVTSPKMESIPVQEGLGWSREALAHAAMLIQGTAPRVQQTSSLQGQASPVLLGGVRDAATATPVSGATVSLLMANQPVKVTQTNGNGRYSFDGISPAKYTLKVEKDSYLTAYYGQPMSQLGLEVSVEANRQYELDVFMVRAGSISGRLLDIDRQPADGAQIQLMIGQFTTQQQRVLAPAPGVRPIRADANGDYAISDIPPGNYFIRATDLRSQSTSSASTTTYYPGATNLQSAISVNLTSQNPIARNIDFSFVATPLFAISGRIVVPQEILTQTQPAPTISLYLVPQNTSSSRVIEQLQPLRDADPEPTSFRLERVQPGPYDLWVGVSAGRARNSPVLVGRFSLVVTDKSLEDVTVPIAQGVELAGQFLTDQPSDVGRLQLLLVSVEGLPAPLAPTARFDSSLVRADGSFTLPYVVPGRYKLEVAGPQDMYLAQASLGPRQILGQSFDIEAGTSAGPLQLQMKRDGGRLAGVVLTATSTPVPGAQIRLIPSLEFRDDPSAYKFGFTNEQGAFTVSGIRPGTYTVFAFDQIENNAWTNTEYMSTYMSSGVSIALNNGQQTSTTLRLITTRK